jgi:hypothetical protein
MIDVLRDLVGLIFTIFTWTWPIIALGLIYLIWRNVRARQNVENLAPVPHVLLTIQVPRENEKKELSAEQMFAAIHGILRPRAERLKEGVPQEHISFEIVSVEEHIRFYVWTPVHLRDFVEGQIYAQYPDVEITESDDYSQIDRGTRHIEGTELVLTKPEVFPIKTFQSFEVDPLAGITAVLAKLEQSGEQVWIQILARPVEDDWQNKGLKYVEAIKAGKTPMLSGNIALDILDGMIDAIGLFIHRLFTAPENDKPAQKPEISSAQSTINGAIEEKAVKLGYEVKIRIAYIADSEEMATQRLQAAVGAFKQFNTTNLNGFTSAGRFADEEFLKSYQERHFPGQGYILNIEELASLYHLPHANVATPNIDWASYRKSEAPPDLPIEGSAPDEDLTLFGKTNFRNRGTRFGILRDDRRRHIYVIGKTGMGKSYMLEGMAISDIMKGEGVAFVDPHGDAIEKIMQYIPEDRIDDVILFDPSNAERPIAFNPLEVPSPEWRNLIASNLVGVLKKIWADSWGPRMEYILRLTLLALLETEDATMLGVTRMLTDKSYRKKVVDQVQDPVVKHFWVNEFNSYTEKFANEAVAPILNKVGQFLSTTTIRNIVGQPKSTFDLRAAMDEGKIILVNLATGKIGEDNAALLGAMMITKMQLAAMSRANVPEEDRRDFYLYVDEFQNFATDSFAVILSEARKYRLSLIMANQYIMQMPETVKNAVFGNVGTMIAFRIGAGDAAMMEKEFAPAFEASDLVNLPKYNIYLKMMIDGVSSKPFSAQTLTLSDVVEGHEAEIKRRSLERYGRPVAEVEHEINRWTGLDMDMIEERIRVQERAEEQRAAALVENREREREERRGRRPRGGESGDRRNNDRRPGSADPRLDNNRRGASAPSRAQAKPVTAPALNQKPTEQPRKAEGPERSRRERASKEDLAAAIAQATKRDERPTAPAPSRTPAPAPEQTFNGNGEAQRAHAPEPRRIEPVSAGSGEIKPGETIRFE